MVSYDMSYQLQYQKGYNPNYTNYYVPPVWVHVPTSSQSTYVPTCTASPSMSSGLPQTSQLQDRVAGAYGVPAELRR